MSQENVSVHKVVLSSKKEVLLREMKIRHQELAAKICGKKAGDNMAYLSTLMQSELLKMLIVQVDGKPVSPTDIESLDNIFSILEYRQLIGVVSKLMGGDDMGEPKIEIGLSGGA